MEGEDGRSLSLYIPIIHTCTHPHLCILPPSTRPLSLLLAGHADPHGPQGPIETHRSTLPHNTQGTLTHMAPEIMLEGKISKAADVRGEGEGGRRRWGGGGILEKGEQGGRERGAAGRREPQGHLGRRSRRDTHSLPSWKLQ